VEWLSRLEQSLLAPHVSSPGGRRVVFVTNVGASNVKVCVSRAQLPSVRHSVRHRTQHVLR
jgi:hypothetical protein